MRGDKNDIDENESEHGTLLPEMRTQNESRQIWSVQETTTIRTPQRCATVILHLYFRLHGSQGKIFQIKIIEYIRL